jgi:hypothetical protein
VIIFLVAVPITGLVLGAISVIANLCSDNGGMDHWTPMPDGEEYKFHKQPQTEYPDIADQLDGRLTNVFKNPMKGIL